MSTIYKPSGEGVAVKLIIREMRFSFGAKTEGVDRQ